MSWSEREVREAFAASLGAPPRADCPSPDVIWDALNLAVPPDRRYAIVLHTASCRHCAQAWQAAKLIAEESQGKSPPAPRPGPPWWRRWLTLPVMAPALAGAAALLVALIWLGPRDLGPVAPPVDSGVMRGLQNAPVLLTPDGVELAIGDALAWQAMAGASHYKVIMYSQDGDRRLELPAVDRLPIDTEVIETFGAGQPVYWYVVAIDGDEPGAESEVRRFALGEHP